MISSTILALSAASIRSYRSVSNLRSWQPASERLSKFHDLHSPFGCRWSAAVTGCRLRSHNLSLSSLSSSTINLHPEAMPHAIGIDLGTTYS